MGLQAPPIPTPDTRGEVGADHRASSPVRQRERRQPPGHAPPAGWPRRVVDRDRTEAGAQQERRHALAMPKVRLRCAGLPRRSSRSSKDERRAAQHDADQAQVQRPEQRDACRGVGGREAV